jgi:hypothetical protein
MTTTKRNIRRTLAIAAISIAATVYLMTAYMACVGLA